MCELLVGLIDVKVLGVRPALRGPMEVVIETDLGDVRPRCVDCDTEARSKGRAKLRLVDLPSMGRPVRLEWRKRRWFCPNNGCDVGSWSETAHHIAAARQVMTRRAGIWATEQVGRIGRTVADVAAELGCDWHTVNDTVIAWGEALLVADTARIGVCRALGLDETSFVRWGRYKELVWATTIYDVGGGRLLDVVEGRSTHGPTAWLRSQGRRWLDGIRWATLDMSGGYRAVFEAVTPNAALVADPFHVVRLANQALDEVRRRVQNETLGHRGHKHDPLYRARRLLVMAEEKHSPESRARMDSMIAAGDPAGEVRDAWLAKEAVRDIYTRRAPDTALAHVVDIGDDLAHGPWPPECQRLGRTLLRWAEPIANWHRSGLSNAATEAANNLIKRVKRVGFGFRNFRNYRIRILLYAGRPNWALLDTINPTQIR